MVDYEVLVDPSPEWYQVGSQQNIVTNEIISDRNCSEEEYLVVKLINLLKKIKKISLSYICLRFGYIPLNPDLFFIVNTNDVAYVYLTEKGQTLLE